MHDKSPEADSGSAEGSGLIARAIQTEQLITVPYANHHCVSEFRCARSERVQGFFASEAKTFYPNYCRIFIAPSPADEKVVLGYYTLSAALVAKTSLSSTDEKRINSRFRGIPAPMVRVGFMGRDDSAPKGLGSGLIVDAARRVYVSDVAAWGLILEPEGGNDNPKLVAWYEAQGFKRCKPMHDGPMSMYAPLRSLVPELNK